MMNWGSLLLRRHLAIAILLVLAALVWSGIVEPIIGFWRVRANQADNSLRSLAVFRRAAAPRQALEAQERELLARDAAQRGFIEGTTATVAAAKLQSDVKHIIETQSGQVASTQLLHSAPESGFEKIAVRVDFKTSTDSLPSIAYAIDAAMPSLFIENVSVRAPETPAQSTTAANVFDLSVRWDVYAYTRGSSP
jgi:general secretion pathway protein M